MIEAIDEATLNEIERKGSAIYERLRPEIEAEHLNEFIAIHVETGDYSIGKSAGQASRAMRITHPPDGRMFVRKIGEEPEYGLAARIMAGEMMTRSKK